MAQLVWNQVLNKNDYISPRINQGVEFTANYEDGTITVNGTSTASSDSYSEYLPFDSYTISLTVVKDHKYLFLSHNYFTNSLFRWIIGGTGDSVFDYEEVYTRGTIKTGLASKTGTSYMILRVGGGITVSNQVTKPMLIDLTTMFGSGNEPATVDEFLSMFPNPPYFYGTNGASPVVNSACSKIYMNKSIEWNQMVNYSSLPKTKANCGITFTNNGDGTFTVNGTASGEAQYYIITSAGIVGHKYFLCGCPSGGSSTTYSITSGIRLSNVWKDGFSDLGSGGKFSRALSTGEDFYVHLTIKKGYTVDNLVFKPQLFDLTQMFGAGNEPSTVAEFWSYFENKVYPYNAGETQKLFKTARRVKMYTGKQITWNQLFDKSQFSTTKSEYGMNFTNNGDGTWTVVGTKNITQGDNFYLTTVQLTSGHKYFLTGKLPSNKDYKMELLQSPTQYDAWREGGIFTCTVSGEFKAYMDIYETNVEVVFKPQLFDLTQMFGAGNEPSTPAEFWSYFENKVYDYDSGTTKPLFRISRKNSWCIRKSETPQKGDLLLLDGSTSIDHGNSCRVIKINGSIAEVITNWASGFSSTFGNSLVYAGSSLDTYCNETVYNSLSSNIKNAIIEKTFRQDSWIKTYEADLNQPYYVGISSYNGSNETYKLKSSSSTFGDSITRKCYVLSVQDVLDYLGATTDMTESNTTITAANISKIFDRPEEITYLSSKMTFTDGTDSFDATTIINSNDNSIDIDEGDPSSDSLYVYCAFQIDLSKVKWVTVEEEEE